MQQNTPILPLANSKVLLPGILVKFVVEQKEDLQMLNKMKDDNVLAVVPVENLDATTKNTVKLMTSWQSKKSRSRLSVKDLFGYGCLARIASLSKDSRGYLVVTLEGISRFKVVKFNEPTSNFPLSCQIQELPEQEASESDLTAKAAIETFRLGGRELVSALNTLQLPPAVVRQLTKMLDSTSPGQLADVIVSMIDVSYQEKLEVLKTYQLVPRLTRVLELIKRQLQVFSISQKLSQSVENKLSKKQREIILREQLEAIKKELGETEEDDEGELADISKKVKVLELPSDEHKKVASRELGRLKRMNPNMSEHQILRTYLEWLIDLPWNKGSTDRLDIQLAKQTLNNDHFGLDKIKTRIIEYLSIRKLKKDLKGPILCFLGPPGTGKTSLGKSIANALGRKFYRIALGGVKDEAEIRGHRRTYVGSMPGLIIQAIKRSGVNNPVILLDEIDKLGRDQRGDPASALLEVLDPEQNSTFSDHYLNLSFDLSKVLFIATANDYDTIPPPLLDRMELIRLSGYTINEKLEIARNFLLPKQIAAHGLPMKSVTMTDKVLEQLIVGYTREAGVRTLEREIASICRKVAVEFAYLKIEDAEAFVNDITLEKLEQILGTEVFENEVAQRQGVPGVVTGLAYSSSGSGGLLFIEASSCPGKGQLVLTGKLGDVIKESAKISLSWVKTNFFRLKLDTPNDFFEKNDIHIHFPAGATPKDGPSAGIAITVSLISMLQNKAISNFTAMTGEITLHGQVLPVGGIKEKLLAAHRGRIKKVLIPRRNQKDLQDVPAKVRQEMDIQLVSDMWSVLDFCSLVTIEKEILARL